MILCEWVVMIRELGFGNVRSNVVQSRKGEGQIVG